MKVADDARENVPPPSEVTEPVPTTPMSVAVIDDTKVPTWLVPETPVVFGAIASIPVVDMISAARVVTAGDPIGGRMTELAVLDISDCGAPSRTVMLTG